MRTAHSVRLRWVGYREPPLDGFPVAARRVEREGRFRWSGGCMTGRAERTLHYSLGAEFTSSPCFVSLLSTSRSKSKEAIVHQLIRYVEAHVGFDSYKQEYQRAVCC
nr:28S ribosomal protein S33, mitochondrial isoform X2 [Caretta caretta]